MLLRTKGCLKFRAIWMLASWLFVLNDNVIFSKVWKRTIFLGRNIQDHTLCFAITFSGIQNKCRLPDSCNICMWRWINTEHNRSTKCHQNMVSLANFLSSLAKWLSVRLRTKWLWVWVPLQSLKVVLYLLLLNRKNVL